jgi:hypothetical protein
MVSSAGSPSVTTRPVVDVQKPAMIPPITQSTRIGRPIRTARPFHGETTTAAGAALGLALGEGFLLGGVGPFDSPDLPVLLLLATASLYPARAAASSPGKGPGEPT